MELSLTETRAAVAPLRFLSPVSSSSSSKLLHVGHRVSHAALLLR
jgi:hypothetical protein